MEGNLFLRRIKMKVEKRTKIVKSRFNETEIELLRRNANGEPLGAFLRNVGLGNTIKEVYKIKKIYTDRKSTRLNSSHVRISYAVFCLKKKTIHQYLVHQCLDHLVPARAHSRLQLCHGLHRDRCRQDCLGALLRGRRGGRRRRRLSLLR